MLLPNPPKCCVRNDDVVGGTCIDQNNHADNNAFCVPALTREWLAAMGPRLRRFCMYRREITTNANPVHKMSVAFIQKRRRTEGADRLR